MRYILFTLFLSLVLNTSLLGKSKSEVILSEGVLSNYQFRGIFSGPLQAYMDFPDLFGGGVTGALFVTARSAISNKFILGATVGLDHQSARLSYGGPHTSTYSYVYSSGNYKRRSYTIAAECLFVGERYHNSIFYSGIGIGYTYSSELYKFVDNVRYASMFYGPSGMVPTNPYKHTRSEVAWQVTIVGVEAHTHSFCFGAEIGYGYKGIGNVFAGYIF
jgi:hypothetical protein